ncbi:hypothetical protein [Nocardiopsis ganjiahuensis]|uniref:hypothetical protein n=1 Tax=Nocardiopsis ganjiahuensis TaxID=239984 RepID=UPI00034B6CEA|nr:hypothetical protein [Nocardiopsis ganjiahuensis]
MIRLTHRRCRDEASGLADTAARQATLAEGLYIENAKLTARNEDLADGLRATEHALDEVVDACRSLSYGLGDEVNIPDALRSRLRDAAQLPEVLHRLDEAQEEKDRMAREHDAQREALLVAAHEAGTLARTWALMARAGHTVASSGGPGALLNSVHTTAWCGFSSWPCEEGSCAESTRTLAWHPDHPDQAHLACECGRIWRAGAEAVQRTRREQADAERFGTSYRTPLPWQHRSGVLLEAIDRALPTPAQMCRELAA